jgi:hypothetical protein
MAATVTKNTIEAIRKKLDEFEAACSSGVPVDGPVYFADVARLAATAAAAAQAEFGEEL